MPAGWHPSSHPHPTITSSAMAGLQWRAWRLSCPLWCAWLVGRQGCGGTGGAGVRGGGPAHALGAPWCPVVAGVSLALAPMPGM